MNIRSLIVFCFFVVITNTTFSQQKSVDKFIVPSANEYSLKSIGLDDYPHQKTIDQLLQMPKPDNWKSTNINKNEYLDIMEKIVRKAATWLDAKGAIIDPYYKAEWDQTTPRFVSSAAILLHFGRISDLKPLVLKSMTYTCNQLATRKAGRPDFWIRELSTSFINLKPLVSEEISQGWRSTLQLVNPEKTYVQIDVAGNRLDTLNNWAVFSSCGEYTREKFGLTPSAPKFLTGEKFFEKYMKVQLVHFVKEGMYREPDDPLTYDFTTRLQITNAFAYGYNGKLKNEYNELLRRGALTTLLYASPEGFAPYGGRSSQFMFQEAIIAALSEFEAQRYKGINDQLSGAFKRQAHISALTAKRWINDMEPMRHIKNGFAPELLHGLDPYAKYSVYILAYSSILGLASIYADDSINEYPCPAEQGGYVFEVNPAFHKVFATVKDTYIEIDTKANSHYESTGLGRFLVKNVPVELGLGMSFTNHPNYTLANDSLKPTSEYAIGPEWKINNSVFSLAGLSEGLEHKLVRHQINKDTVEFDIEYKNKEQENVTIFQHYKLSNHNLSITSQIISPNTKVDSIYFTVPLLVTNGQSQSKFIENGNKVLVNYLGCSYEITMDKNSSYKIGKESFANRNGVYKNLIVQQAGNQINVNLKLKENN